MNRLPSVTATQHLVDALDALRRRPRDSRLADRYGTTLDAIRHRLVGTDDSPGAIRREAHGTNLPDGYPGTTLGDGPRGTAELTPVEAAAHRRAKPPRDQHRDLTQRAVDNLDRAVASIAAVMDALAALDDLCGDGRPEPRTCDACHPHRDIIAPVHARGTVGGRLPEPVDLCKACYGYVEQAGRLPTTAEVDEHEQRGRWRIRSTTVEKALTPAGG